MKHIKTMLACLCLSGLATAQQYPLSSVSIDITGLDGAEHWVWWEGEEITDFWNNGSSYGLGYTYNYGVSGFGDGDWVRNYYRYDGWEGMYVEYDSVHLPADMSNPTLVARYNANYREQDWDVLIDGSVVGSIHFLNTGADIGASAWASAALTGPLSAGDHILRAVRTSGGGGATGSYDGFFIYDGVPAMPVGPEGGVCYVYSGSSRFMAPPTSGDPANAPVIGAVAKPVVLFNGRDSHERFDITLNGKPFVNGTVIDQPGYYELVVSVSSIPGMRGAYAGANFRLGGTSSCGDPGHPYPTGDLNDDCYVNWADFSVFASHWLECTDPGAPCNYVP